MRARYKHLLPSKSSACRVNFWASSTNRVVETARYFATGFFGLNWTTNLAALHIISNSSDLGADTLTPQDTCLNYRTDIELGHDYGYTQLSRFSATYLPQIGERLRRDNPDIEFTGREIYSMQEMCGFEILARGESPWCNGRLSFGSANYPLVALHEVCDMSRQHVLWRYTSHFQFLSPRRNANSEIIQSLLTRIGTTSNMRETSFTITELDQATASGLLWAGFG